MEKDKVAFNKLTIGIAKKSSLGSIDKINPSPSSNQSSYESPK